MNEGKTAMTAMIGIDGKSAEYPVHQGSIGPEVVDIRKLYANTGRFTFDPGFTSTASCESKPSAPTVN